MPRLLLCAVCSFISVLSFSQNSLYTQYFFNPYPINPAFVAFSGQKEANINYRKQWTGIKNSPKSLQADFQLPINSRINVGVNMTNEKSILLNTTSLFFTFGYLVRLHPDHTLRFGISGGFLSNRIRTEDLPAQDLNDPALSNAAYNNFCFDGQFGASYVFKGLTLGFSLLNLVNNNSFSPEQFQKISFSNLRNQSAFASYRIALPNELAITPTAAYRKIANHEDVYEGGVILSLKNVLDIGVGYRQNFGVNTLLRMKWEKFELGYSYDLPSTYYEVSTGGSHEIQIKYRFGERNVSPFAPTNIQKTQKHYQRMFEKHKQTHVSSSYKRKKYLFWTSQEKKRKEAKLEDEFDHEFYSTEELTTLEEAVEGDLHQKADGRKWYLILGVFTQEENARDFVVSLKRKGVEAEVKKTTQDNRFYVHVPSMSTETLSENEILDIRSQPVYKDAWFRKLD